MRRKRWAVFSQQFYTRLYMVHRKKSAGPYPVMIPISGDWKNPSSSSFRWKRAGFKYFKPFYESTTGWWWKITLALWKRWDFVNGDFLKLLNGKIYKPVMFRSSLPTRQVESTNIYGPIFSASPGDPEKRCWTTTEPWKIRCCSIGTGCLVQKTYVF